MYQSFSGKGIVVLAHPRLPTIRFLPWHKAVLSQATWKRGTFTVGPGVSASEFDESF